LIKLIKIGRARKIQNKQYLKNTVMWTCARKNKENNNEIQIEILRIEIQLKFEYLLLFFFFEKKYFSKGDVLVLKI
jgi:hypothetical protein